MVPAKVATAMATSVPTLDPSDGASSLSSSRWAGGMSVDVFVARGMYIYGTVRVNVKNKA